MSRREKVVFFLTRGCYSLFRGKQKEKMGKKAEEVAEWLGIPLVASERWMDFLRTDSVQTAVEFILVQFFRSRASFFLFTSFF